MIRRLGRMLVGAYIGLSYAGQAWAQVPCTSPPPASVSVTPAVTAGTSLVPALINVTWAGVPTSGPAAVTSYFVEAGSSSGLRDLARIDTGTSGATYAHPAASGTYYLRVVSKNACGTSAPSPEVRVDVTGSTLRGQPGARAIAPILSRDIFGDVLLMGEVRGALGGRATPFIKVTASFTGSAGELVGTDFTYITGRSRRLRLSRIIDAATLDSTESVCYRMFTNIPAATVSGGSVSVSWSTSELEALRGNVVVHSIRQEADAFGDLKVVGQLRNAGTTTTYFNEAVLDVRDAQNRVIDCDSTYVDGSTIQLPSGISTDTALTIGQIAPFLNYNRPRLADVSRVITWTQWQEADRAGLTAASSSWRRFTPDHTTEPIDPKQRARARDLATEQLRALSDRIEDR